MSSGGQSLLKHLTDVCMVRCIMLKVCLVSYTSFSNNVFCKMQRPLHLALYDIMNIKYNNTVPVAILDRTSNSTLLLLLNKIIMYYLLLNTYINSNNEPEGG